MILIVCALAGELRDFRTPAAVRVIACGVGPVEAALGTARALATGSYTACINAGIAGVFRGRGAVGDAFIVTSETLADFGLEGGASLVLPDGAQLRERERASEALVKRCDDLHLRAGSGLTVTAVTATDATAARLSARYGADVESMEGFSVLRAAAEAGVAALEVRGISNYVGDRAASEWSFPAGARATARALESVVGRLSQEE